VRRIGPTLEALFARLQVAGVSVTGVRRHPEASCAMAKGLDGFLLGVFQSECSANESAARAG
jgi:hypothetical protein